MNWLCQLLTWVYSLMPLLCCLKCGNYFRAHRAFIDEWDPGWAHCPHCSLAGRGPSGARMYGQGIDV